MAELIKYGGKEVDKRLKHLVVDMRKNKTDDGRFSCSGHLSDS
jgi:hypothetical protein